MQGMKNDFLKGIKENVSFLKAFFSHPLFMGTVLPTSKHAAHEMAELIDNTTDGYVLELGPGTGIITQALIDHGIDPRKIITIEHSAEFIKTLQQKFPQTNVIHGDAEKLIAAAVQGKKISAVISSIPVVSLPKEKVEVILTQIKQILAKDGKYIQLTYNFNENKFDALKLFKHIGTKRVVKNLPPVRFDIYQV